ncbi:MAG: hypothetical protein DSY80_09340 [Desulfocapsa sp.]|nr:MAG: hypothetical protein DSY80_09340 [Desulfocapsa sp.]
MLSWNLRERSSIIYKVLHLIDCAIVVLFLAILVRLYGIEWNPYYTNLEIITFVLCFLSFDSFQLYRSWRGWKYYREFIVIIKAWATVVGILLCYFFLLKISWAYSRVVFMIWSLTTPFLLFICHIAVRSLLRHLRLQGKNIRHAVIAGAGDLGKRMAEHLENIPWAGIEVVGFFDDKIDSRDATGNVSCNLLGKLSEIRGYLQEHDIDYVYISLPMRAEKKIFTILQECRDLGAEIFLVPDLYIFGLHHAEIQSLGDMLVLNFNPDTRWKRIFDIIFSSLVLVLGSPFFIVTALVIKIDSRGPVFYRHGL